MSEEAPADAGATESLPPEDLARGNFYALLARLFSAAPDSRLLAAIAVSAPLEPLAEGGDEGGTAGDLAAAWDTLRASSAAAEAAALAEEFQTLFIGVGRSEVSLYASHYLAPQSGRPLSTIRAALAELGLARQSARSEFEDHFATLLEAMRMLVAGDATRVPASIAAQKDFFERHIGSWAAACCSAIEQSPVAIYYRDVAQFAICFLMLERESLAMD